MKKLSFVLASLIVLVLMVLGVGVGFAIEDVEENWTVWRAEKGATVWGKSERILSEIRAELATNRETAKLVKVIEAKNANMKDADEIFAGWDYEVPTASYAELLIENEELKRRVAAMEGHVGRVQDAFIELEKGYLAKAEELGAADKEITRLTAEKDKAEKVKTETETTLASIVGAASIEEVVDKAKEVVGERDNLKMQVSALEAEKNEFLDFAKKHENPAVAEAATEAAENGGDSREVFAAAIIAAQRGKVSSWLLVLGIVAIGGLLALLGRNYIRLGALTRKAAKAEDDRKKLAEVLQETADDKVKLQQGFAKTAEANVTLVETVKILERDKEIRDTEVETLRAALVPKNVEDYIRAILFPLLKIKDIRAEKDKDGIKLQVEVKDEEGVVNATSVRGIVALLRRFQVKNNKEEKIKLKVLAV